MSDPTEPRPAASPGEVEREAPGRRRLLRAEADLSRRLDEVRAALGSRDDDQRDEVGRLHEANEGLGQALIEARAGRDAEKARADAAEEALAGVRARIEELADSLAYLDSRAAPLVRALLPADTAEDGR